MKLNKKLILGISLLLVLGFAGLISILVKNLNKVEIIAMKYDFTVVAEKDDSAGVDLDSGFIITSNEDYPLNTVKNIIKLEPELDFDITKKGSGNYYLKTKTALADNTIYNIYAVNENEPDLAWAFQTKTNFEIISTLPAKNAENVPVNTGIEIMFSKTPAEIDSYFSISPKVSGKFEKIGKKVCFIPSESLAYNTKYTVTVKKDFRAIDESILNNDYIYSFTTANAPKSSFGNIYITNDINETFTTSDTQLIELRALKGDFSNEKFFIDIYDLQTPENYIEEIKNSNNGLSDVSKYSKVSSFDANLVSENYFYSYIVLPENLSEGWYLADITTSKGIGDTKNQHLQKLIQVSDISVYIQSYNTETVVWCNDVIHEKPLDNATINIDNTKNKTNENGVSIFYIDRDEKVPVYISAEDGRKFAEYLYLSEKKTDTLDDMYYMFFYTDREVYLPTDTINYWGVVLPKKSGAVVPKSMILKWNGNSENERISINSDGSFSGKIEFSRLISNYYSLNLAINEFDTVAKTIEISEYVKPTYVLNSSFDKSYYRSGETAKINVSGTFFDGTPAEALKLKMYIDGEEKDITLNDAGNRLVSYKMDKDRNTWNPVYITSSVHTTGYDEDAETYDSAYYFPTDYMFETEWEENNLILKANKIDYNSIINGSINYEKLAGAKSVASGEIEVIRNENVRTEIGTYYDYINKVNKKRYSYDTIKESIDNFTFSTVDGLVKIPIDYPKEDNVYYTFKINYTLADGFNGTTSAYKYNFISYEDENNYKNYTLKANKSKFGTKEEVNLELYCNGDKVENTNKLLYVVSQDKIKDIAVTQKSEFSLIFNENYIPSVTVCGAYFDGSRIYPLSAEYLLFDTDERELKVNITTDKENYKPGETVTMTVETKDKFGKTYPTKLVMSVVDEAAFAIQDQYISPLSDLYSYRFYYPNQYVSYLQHTDYVTAEGGGDGMGEAYRSEFEDTAAFITITTGSNGKTTASFKLPDNLTSWRITAIGITDNLRAGYDKKNITVGLPFFVNQVINEKYTSGDSVVFTSRIAGAEKNKLLADVKYTATVNGENFNKTIDLTSSPDEVAIFDFGMLNEGEYEVLIKATSGKYSDAIKKRIYVIDSLHEIMQAREINLEKIDIKALKYPVNLVFYDVDNALYYRNMKKILDTSWGNTNEQKIARNIVYNKVNELSGELIYTIAEVDGVQAYSGGARILSYSDTDTLLTAKICALAPEYIDKVSAKNYFENIINNSDSSSSEISAAYFGLASLKEPVMNDVKYLLNNNKGFSARDNINLISALACIGDINGANEWYVKLLSNSIKEEGVNRYIKVGNDYENYEATSSLIIPLVKINHSDLSKFLTYVLETKSTKYTPALDLASYVIAYNPKKDSIGFINYEINGEKEEINFSGKPMVNLVLTERALKSFKVTDYKNVECIAFYVGGISDSLNNINNKIQVEKTISGGNFVGDEVTTTIKIKFPIGMPNNTRFVLADVIPSGMRYTGMKREYNSNYYLVDNELQKLYFEINSKDNKDVTIIYNTRNLLPGEYMIDSAVIESIDKTFNGYSDRSSFNIEQY